MHLIGVTRQHGSQRSNGFSTTWLIQVYFTQQSTQKTNNLQNKRVILIEDNRSVWSLAIDPFLQLRWKCTSKNLNSEPDDNAAGLHEFKYTSIPNFQIIIFHKCSKCGVVELCMNSKINHVHVPVLAATSQNRRDISGRQVPANFDWNVLTSHIKASINQQNIKGKIRSILGTNKRVPCLVMKVVVVLISMTKTKKCLLGMSLLLLNGQLNSSLTLPHM